MLDTTTTPTRSHAFDEACITVLRDRGWPGMDWEDVAQTLLEGGIRISQTSCDVDLWLSASSKQRMTRPIPRENLRLRDLAGFVAVALVAASVFVPTRAWALCLDPEAVDRVMGGAATVSLVVALALWIAVILFHGLRGRW